MLASPERGSRLAAEGDDPRELAARVGLGDVELGVVLGVDLEQRRGRLDGPDLVEGRGHEAGHDALGKGLAVGEAVGRDLRERCVEPLGNRASTRFAYRPSRWRFNAYAIAFATQALSVPR